MADGLVAGQAQASANIACGADQAFFGVGIVNSSLTNGGLLEGPFSVALPHAQHDDGLVVEAVFAALKAGYVFENCVGDGKGRLVATGAEQAL